jgi:hypothetical protein
MNRLIKPPYGVCQHVLSTGTTISPVITPSGAAINALSPA